MTYLDISLAPIGARWGGESVLSEMARLFAARRALEQYLALRLKTDAVYGNPCTRHVAMIHRLEDPDTILSLNYDLLIDRALHCCGDERLNRLLQLTAIPAFPGGEPMAPRPGETQPGLYLKLHGSMDWATCPRVGCSNHEHLSDMRQAGWERHIKIGEPCRRCGTPLILGIVTPSLLKEFDRLPKIALLWVLAHRKLETCRRLYAIGVSLAASDFALRWLLRHALTFNRKSPDVVVVNPNGDAYSEFRCLLSGVAVKHDSRRFEEWVQEPA